ncbi:hypothetical protein PISMIDRAFT_345857 [Pisolithus microcarpus 441]|uniref:Uncharacterized protein n=1 Tax=Pisolithus microcarpus 441 TaxID=765257 RepID=A0A0C9YLH3_9AGAM|nr:hypothetical protein PISMIDRAFT_345857 [Pisolithus microcarpus 441]
MIFLRVHRAIVCSHDFSHMPIHHSRHAQETYSVHVLMHSDLRSVLPNFRLPRILILADTLNPPLSLRNFPTIPNPHAMIQRIWLAPLKFIHRLVVVGERGGARCGRSLVSGDITERCGCVVDTELIGATSGFGSARGTPRCCIVNMCTTPTR